MAVENPVQSLCHETSCPICLDYFSDPVVTDCGHVFCQACITRYWGESMVVACACPQCRQPCQRNKFRPVRQLASIVEIAKQFSLQTSRGTESVGKLCSQHQEPLKLFCEDDQALLCVVCDKSRGHRGHTVIPKEEAFGEYKDAGAALKRCNIQECVTPSSSELKQETEKMSKTHSSLKPVMKKFKDAVLLKKEEISNEDIEIPKLALSRERQQARVRFLCPDSPLECWSYVMGAERITSGRHTRIADVGDEPFWAVGVARKRELRFGIRIWAIETSFNRYISFTSSKISLGPVTSLNRTVEYSKNLQQMPRRIRVILNYDDRSIAFFEADKNTRLFAFSKVPLEEGEELCFWHSVGHY